MDIRAITYNIHKARGWGSIKNTLATIRHQLIQSQADIVFLQEIRGVQFESLSSDYWPYSVYGKNTTHIMQHHGNAILSKYPIELIENVLISNSRYEKRGFLYALCRFTPNKHPLHLICTHLSLLENNRKKQLNKIISFIQERIPANDRLILAGDFNDWRKQVTKRLISEIDVNEVFFHEHKKYARTFPAWAPILTLDRIYYRGLQQRTICRHAKSPWKQLSDHLAIEAVFTI